MAVWIEPRPTGFRVRWHNTDGTKNSGHLFPGRVEAEEFVEHVRRRLKAKKSPVSPTDLASYAREAVLEMEGIRQSTRQNHMERVALIARRFGDTRLTSIRQEDVVSLLADMKKEGRHDVSRNLLLFVLKRTFAKAVREGVVTPEEDPTKGVTVRVNRWDHVPSQPLELEQVEAVAESIRPSMYRLAVLLGGYCGLRFGEVAALMEDAVDRENRELRVFRGLQRVGRAVGAEHWLQLGPPKTRSSVRSVPLDDWLLEELETHTTAHPPVEGRLFYASRGGLLQPPSFGKAFRTACIRAGVPDEVSFHDLRHTFASLLIREGAHPKVVQSLLGHANIAMTMDLYGHLFPGMGREWVERLGAARHEARRARLHSVS